MRGEAGWKPQRRQRCTAGVPLVVFGVVISYIVMSIRLAPPELVSSTGPTCRRVGAAAAGPPDLAPKRKEPLP